jgi:hypothetical protein
MVLIRPKLFGFGEGVGGGVRSVILEFIPELFAKTFASLRRACNSVLDVMLLFLL